jgi:hypothetical protein
MAMALGAPVVTELRIGRSCEQRAAKATSRQCSVCKVLVRQWGWWPMGLRAGESAEC